MFATALRRRTDRAGIARPDAIIAALTRAPGLADEQEAMVRRLCGDGPGVAVVVGKAGSGKTAALAAAHDAWQHSGLHVVGCALAGRAAQELQTAAGIPSHTIDRLLAWLDTGDHHGRLTARSVLVVDEAGMVDTRTLARLVRHTTRARAKLVLVGDHHQLPEIGAGGVFRGLVDRLGPITLDTNRRQHQAWERAALDNLRDGDPARCRLRVVDPAGIRLLIQGVRPSEALEQRSWRLNLHGSPPRVTLADSFTALPGRFTEPGETRPWPLKVLRTLDPNMPIVSLVVGRLRAPTR